MFPTPLATWTPEVIRQEDVPESFELFVSYSTEYGALRFFDDNLYEYRGPMNFYKDNVEVATKWDIVHYRRFVSETIPRSSS